MSTLNLNDLEVFVQVVDHGGFTAASRKLGVPKSTLSKRIKELEQQAGVRLIHRTSRSFTVTELGQSLYRHASAMLIEAEAAENVVFGRLAEPSGTVRVTASIPTAQHFLAPLLPEVAAAYPKIRVALHITDGFVDIVQEGIDIAIRDHMNPLPDSGLVQRRLCTDPFWLVASAAYLAQLGSIRQPSDLENAEGLFPAPGDTGWTLSNSGRETQTVTLPARYYANETTPLLEAAKAGLGITCLPSRLCSQAVTAGHLTRVLPDWTAGKITSTLLMPHRRGQLPSVRVVADLIIQQLGDQPSE
ncbi:LysR family transcriptional regulator [Natronospirillum operosum]|uniref:LysR family transcriptional regulator n=1 Tax=Natronospirillum operosum TaxID=2759953 RepID=A0A4Z0W6F3_9GAMM|nr:LysR substrate-binding domain-containing protein [Natronospirillum operosum]TGG91713.1 LysR family transcriptional regulator [Natronospirillum operosum]